MTREEVLNSLGKKMIFVAELGRVVSKFQANIECMHYDVFCNKEHETWITEYLVIEYVGGAKTIRCCTGNSVSAIFEEISKYLTSGHYSEQEDYQFYVDAVKAGTHELLAEIF